jgi:hypothetical protein
MVATFSMQQAEPAKRWRKRRACEKQNPSLQPAETIARLTSLRSPGFPSRWDNHNQPDFLILTFDRSLHSDAFENTA